MEEREAALQTALTPEAASHRLVGSRAYRQPQPCKCSIKISYRVQSYTMAPLIHTSRSALLFGFGQDDECKVE